jgi:membrane protein YdbS with pleckstrin-like domain
MQAKRKHLFDKPRNVRRLLYVLYSICALLLAIEFLYQRDSQHAWDSWPGFYAGYGFVGCVLLVLVAKLLRRFLQRPANYYDDGDDEP